MVVENGLPVSKFSLPPVADASFSSTPQRNGSRRSSRRAMTPPSSSPAGRSMVQGEENDEVDDKISVLDPRRFTPTLHANLVSEILNLRREVESKNRVILDLEENLSTVRDDNTKLNGILVSREKEASGMKRQIQVMEGSTMSALDELAQDRDKSHEALVEVKRRLEASQKKLKGKEEEVDRTNALWAGDQERWAIEKRQLDHKIHVVEGRLKMVLSEVEAAHVNGVRMDIELVDRSPSRTGSRAGDRSQSRTSNRALSRNGARSSLSQRRSSSVSTDGAAKRFRLSHISEGGIGDNGATLADELQFDDEFDEYEEDDDFVSLDALPEEQLGRPRPFSAQSHRQSVKARKLLGLAVGDEEECENVRDVIIDALDLPSDGLSKDLPYLGGTSRAYIDSATQYSPPQSPLLRPLSIIEEVDDDKSIPDVREASDREATPTNELFESYLQTIPEQKPVMVSSSCQTMEQPPSPPHTPVEKKDATFESSSLPKPIEMSTSSTQTSIDDLPPPAMVVDTPELTPLLDVPTISIRPPSSASHHRGSVVLPPHTKSIACQANIPRAPVRSWSVQTEEIRIDQRPVKLPPHLLPSALDVEPLPSAPTFRRNKVLRPSSSKQEEEADKVLKPKSQVLPNRSAKRSSPRIRASPSRSYSENEKENEISDAEDGDLSDDSFVVKEPIKKTLSKVKNSWKLIDPDDDLKESIFIDSGDTAVFGSTARRSRDFAAIRNSLNRDFAAQENDAAAATDDTNLNKIAVSPDRPISNVQRTRSPSAPPAPVISSVSQPPPFPVPTRSSSRNIPWGSSDGTGSPTPQTVSFFGLDQQSKQKRPPIKRPVIRKVRSATTDFYMQPRTRSRSPPPPKTALMLDSPRLPMHPPLPNDDINSPFRLSFKPNHYQKPSITSVAESAASEQTSVVDAIAQTMIGEWMWKYVRRRATFGRPDLEFDGRNNETSSGARHQRWVWLAPYERAVLWSSKQPTSGPALMGKSGRKLTIQSVLDVRDDSPVPKGAGSATCFGRSILILTPQRALKFTATTRERHYVWLKALSFLSSSSVVPSELGVHAPPTPSSAHHPSSAAVLRQPVSVPPPTAALRRHPIRDSIRIAKGKSRPVLPDGGRRAHTDPRNASSSLLSPLSAHNFDRGGPTEDEGDGGSGAEAPTVPRLSSHTRNRSNTGPRPSYHRTSASSRSISSSINRPSLYSLSGNGNGNGNNGNAGSGSRHTNSNSFQSRAESDVSHGWATDSGAPASSSRYGSAGKRSFASADRVPMAGGPLNSHPTTSASSAPVAAASSPANIGSMPESNIAGTADTVAPSSNFFEAMGTVRMEAFVKNSGRKLRLPGLNNGGGFVNNGPMSAPLERWDERLGASLSGRLAGYKIGQGQGQQQQQLPRSKNARQWIVPVEGEEVKMSGANPFEGF